MIDDKSQKGKNERKRFNSFKDEDLSYINNKLGVTSQVIAFAKRATSSYDRNVIEDYIKNKKK